MFKREIFGDPVHQLRLACGNLVSVLYLIDEQTLWAHSPGCHIAKVQLARYSNLVDESVHAGLLESINAWPADDPSKLSLAPATNRQPAQVSGVERPRDSENSMFVVHVSSRMQ
jgi:hypothetical protein